MREILDTRLLLLPDDQTLLWLTSNLPAKDLLGSIQRGSWFPPDPYASRKPAKCALLFESLVIVTLEPPSNPPEPSGSFTHPIPEGTPLSVRQRQVLRLLAEGYTPKEIAHSLGLSQRQVHRHLKNLRDRFDSTTLAQSISRAASLGLLDE